MHVPSEYTAKYYMLISLWLNENIRLSSLSTYMTLIMWYQGICDCRHMYILSRIEFLHFIFLKYCCS